MTDRILISASVGEIRVALLADGKVVELHFFRDLTPSITGNIYLARVRRLAPEFQGAFLEIEPGVDAFLALKAKAGFGLTEGAKFLVQVNKDAEGEKPAEVTRKITLTGARLLFHPLGKGREISADIEKPRREELAAWLESLPEFTGGIRLRQAAGDDDTARIGEELAAAQELWADIQQREQGKAPACLYREGNPALRFLRDHAYGVSEIVFDRAATLADAQKYLGSINATLTLHKGNDLFAAHKVDAAIASLLSPRLSLPGGGWITIEETEALTAIDVNAGAPRRNMGAAVLAFQTNKEAAREIARQLRLRQIGGLIVVDFINMTGNTHGRQLLTEFDACLKSDPHPVRRTGFSAFGLVELTRKRSGPSLRQRLSAPAMILPTLATCGLQALALAERAGNAQPGRHLVIESDPATIDWLEGKRDTLLAELQSRIGASVTLKPRADFTRGQTNAYTE